jgi:hypothetical protein
MSSSKTLGVSPYFARFGHDVDLLGFESPFRTPSSLAIKDKEFLAKFTKHMETVRKAIKTNVLESQETMSDEYNKQHRAKIPPFTKGSFVLLHSPVKGNSPSVLSHKPYAGGPWVIVDVVQNEGFGPSYRLAHAHTGKVRQSLVPSYRLKPFMSRDNLLQKYGQPEATVKNDVESTANINPPTCHNESQRKQRELTSKPKRILYQKDDNYLVLCDDKTRVWTKRNPALETLIKDWLLKREVSRKRRSESRRKPCTETKRS